MRVPVANAHTVAPVTVAEEYFPSTLRSTSDRGTALFGSYVSDQENQDAYF